MNHCTLIVSLPKKDWARIHVYLKTFVAIVRRMGGQVGMLDGRGE